MPELVTTEQSLEQDVTELHVETGHFRSCTASGSAASLLLAAEQLLCLVLAPQSLCCTHRKCTGALKH